MERLATKINLHYA